MNETKATNKRSKPTQPISINDEKYVKYFKYVISSVRFNV